MSPPFQINDSPPLADAPISTAAEKRDQRKKSGRFYTPNYLVRTILDLSGYRGAALLRKHVVDNSCGDGAFLTEIVERYCREFRYSRECRQSGPLRRENAAELKQELEKFVHGIEINAQESNKCVANLRQIVREFGLDDVCWDVRCADALTFDEFDGKMDFVLGNPPYIRTRRLGESGASLDSLKKFGFAQEGMTDLFLIFYEIGLKMLAPKGILGYVTPSSFFGSLAGARFRKRIVRDNLLEKLVDLGHFQAFDATTYTTIVVLTTGKSNFETEYYEYDGAIRFVDKLECDDFYINNKFYFSSRRRINYLKSIFATGVGDRFVVKNGFATLADSFFIGADVDKFDEFVIPVVKASTGRWTKGLFPYDKSGSLISYETIIKNKKIEQYYKNCVHLLKNRSLRDLSAWYGFGRTQGIKDVGKPKFAINPLVRDASSVKLTFAPQGTGVYGGLYVLTDLGFADLNAALCNDEFIAYLSLLKKYKSGGYYTFSSNDLKIYLEYKFSSEFSSSRSALF